MASGQEPLVLKIAYQSVKQNQAALQSIELVMDGAIGTKISARTPAMVVETTGDTFVSTLLLVRDAR